MSDQPIKELRVLSIENLGSDFILDTEQQRIKVDSTTVAAKVLQMLRESGQLTPTASTATSWIYRGMGPRFSDHIKGMTQIEDTRFGTDVAEGPGVTAIKNTTDLNKYYRPLEGEFSKEGNPLGGTTVTTINAELQRYTTSFEAVGEMPQLHEFTQDSLKLNVKRQAGTFDSYLRTQINTATNGLVINGFGGTVNTPFAHAGLDAATPEQLAKIEVGDIACGAGIGLFYVSAINLSEQWVRFEAITSGTHTSCKADYHLTFTKLAWGEVAQDAGWQATQITFKDPLPTSVVKGCFLLAVDRTSNGYGSTPKARSRARIATVSEDRRTITLDKPVEYAGDDSIKASEKDGFIIVPELWSSQVWSRRSYLPKNGLAIDIEATFPNMPNFQSQGNYWAKAGVDQALATSGIKNGYWPALWLFVWRPGENGDGLVQVPDGRMAWTEIDIMEIFCHINMGQNVWTGNLHNQPYTRKRSYEIDTRLARNKGKWMQDDATDKVLTADSLRLLMPDSLCKNQRVRFSIVWTATHIVHYVNDQPICESEWSHDSDYPMQLGMNVAIGSLAGDTPSELFFPQSNADVDDVWMQVHSVKVYEA